jgi:hypothetical protein
MKKLLILLILISPVSNILVKTRSVPKHPRHILYITNIPISNVFVKVFVMIKQIRHIGYITDIPTDWFYDTVEAIDDVGIAVSGVIVDGVNDIPAGIVDFLEVSIKMVLENP